MKIANKISLSFLALTTILTVIASSISYLIARDNLRQAIYKQLDIVVDENTQNIETYLEMLKISIGQFSKSVVLEDLLREIKKGPEVNKKVFATAIKRLKRTKEANPEIDEFLLLDATGRIVVSSSGKHLGVDKSTDAFFIAGQKGLFIKDAYYSEELKVRLIAVAAPFLDSDSGEFLGVLVARVKMSGLDKILVELDQVNTGEVYIVNKYGYMITPSSFLKNTFLSQRVDTVNFRDCLLYSKQKGTNLRSEHEVINSKVGYIATFLGYRGVKVLGMHRYIPEMQWSVLAEVDENLALAPLVKLYILFLFMLFSVPLCAYLLGIYLARRITEPIYKLYRGTEMIGEGNLDYKVGTDAKDEIGQLARAFDKMSENLKNSTASIEILNKEIFERKRVEEELKKSEAWFSTTLISIGDAVITTDTAGLITFINPVAQELTGWLGSEAVGRHIDEVFLIRKEDTDEKVDNPVLRVLSNGRIVKLANHTVLISKDSSRRAIDDSAAPIKGANSQEIMGVVLVFRDITERKKMLEELKQKNIALEKLDQLKSDFVSIVSHELRTPLSITKEGISLVLDGVVGSINPKQNKILTTSKNNIDRLARIINSLLDISKIESGRVELKKTSVNLLTLINNVVLLFAIKAQEKGIELRVELPKVKEVNLYVDEDRIIQVFTNLIGNALKFTEIGSVTVSLIEKQDEIEFMVSDTGIGIVPEDLPNVFNKFMQFGRVAGGGEKGTGLGLSIAKGLIELHRGQIRVESEVNRGSRFIFTLPRYSIDQIGRDQIEEAINNALRASAHFSLIVATLSYSDKIKQGISAEVLAELEKNIMKELHKGKDLFSRFANEFFIILQDCNKNCALIVQNRIQQIFKSYFESIHLSDDLRVDFGLAVYPEEANSYQELIHKVKKD